MHSIALCLLVLIPFEEIHRAHDISSMQGEWVMDSLEVDGKLVPQNKIQGTTLWVRGNTYQVTVKKRPHEVKLKLYPLKALKEMDMLFPDGPNEPKVGKAIYKIDGDKLTICRSQADGERPQQFGTWPNTGCFMVVWRKVK